MEKQTEAETKGSNSSSRNSKRDAAAAEQQSTATTKKVCECKGLCGGDEE